MVFHSVELCFGFSVNARKWTKYRAFVFNHVKPLHTHLIIYAKIHAVHVVCRDHTCLTPAKKSPIFRPPSHPCVQSGGTKQRAGCHCPIVVHHDKFGQDRFWNGWVTLQKKKKNRHVSPFSVPKMGFSKIWKKIPRCFDDNPKCRNSNF